MGWKNIHATAEFPTLPEEIIKTEGITKKQSTAIKEVILLAEKKIETAADLYTALNGLYENSGEFNTSSMYIGTHSFQAVRYTSGGPKQKGGNLDIDAYYPTEKQAVEALWALLCMLKINPKFLLEQQGQAPVEAPSGIFSYTRIYWRSRPEVKETENKLYVATMRAVLL